MNATLPQKDLFKISSNRLDVEIAKPGSVYRGSRFDWTGFITQVTLDGKHTFCVPESYKLGEGTGGWGICNEFGNQKAVGYEDAQPGETFPKLGIGLLRRPEAPHYQFYHPHEIVQPFTVQVDLTGDQARFNVEPLDCRGYAARVVKTVSVSENWLEIACRLENTGQKTIDTHEYAHNFIGIDQQEVGPEYHLHLPYSITLDDFAPSMRQVAPTAMRKLMPGFLLDKFIRRMANPGSEVVKIKGEEVQFLATPKKPFFFRPLGFVKTDGPQWEIVHQEGCVGLREYDDFVPSREAIWGTTHVLSAEVYVDIHVQPGDSQTWTRRYEFFSDR